jgi:hypothetical protein
VSIRGFTQRLFAMVANISPQKLVICPPDIPLRVVSLIMILPRMEQPGCKELALSTVPAFSSHLTKEQTLLS